MARETPAAAAVVADERAVAAAVRSRLMALPAHPLRATHERAVLDLRAPGVCGREYGAVMAAAGRDRYWSIAAFVAAAVWPVLARAHLRFPGSSDATLPFAAGRHRRGGGSRLGRRLFGSGLRARTAVDARHRSRLQQH